MTQGIYQFPQEQANFRTTEDRLPPCNIEAEEAILGGILLDPDAIYRIKDRLKPEHFYVSAHRDIYQACLRICKQDETTDLLSVTSWLTDHGILSRIGGRNKLATVIDRTVSSTNIEQLAALVIEKAMRRDLIKVANEITHLGYETELDLPQIFSLVADKTRSVIELPTAPTKEEHQVRRHKRLLEDLTKIYTTCADPSLRLLKLKDLENDHHLSMRFMESVYLKSLTGQCGKLLTYEELKELAGSTVREWLLNGLVPKGTTILLASDGGVGKTKLAYGIGKILIQGSAFGVFQSTGEKRRILYYQGDESEGDMLQALETLGYSESDISKYVRVRFGWSAENMPTLIQDLKEFQPELVFIDSLSTANRFSIYRESEMEYARPILEMTGLANQYKTTFVIIHHMNKEGGVRGTTAIRNAVSEVWQLSKDNSNTATPYDRILEINKSRSRSSGKKYRLMFNPEDLGFTFLGEEGEELSGPNQSTKERTLELLASHRNIKFASEEISHRLGTSKDYTRRFMNELSADGLVSVKRQPGKPSTYYLAYEGSDPGSPKDHPLDQYYSQAERITGKGLESSTAKCIKKRGSPLDTPQDHPKKVDTASDTAKGDPRSGENHENHEKYQSTQVFEKKVGVEDQRRLDALSDNNLGGDPRGVTCQKIHSFSESAEVLTDINPSDYPQGDPGGDPLGDPSPQLGYEKVKDFKIGDYVKITSHPTRLDAVGSVEKLRSVGNHFLKTESGIQLCKGEFEKVAPPSEVTPPPAPKPLAAENAPLPLIQEKAIYWSQSQKREVRVFRIFDDLFEVSCQIPGKGTFSLPFTDLLCCQQSPRHNLKVGDEVVILFGKHSETFATITTIRADGIFLKSGSGRSLKKAYFPHQLVKV